MAYSHFRATVRGQHGSDTVQRHVREPPPPPSQLQLGASPHLVRQVTWPPLVPRLRACLGWIRIPSAGRYVVHTDRYTHHTVESCRMGPLRRHVVPRWRHTLQAERCILQGAPAPPGGGGGGGGGGGAAPPRAPRPPPPPAHHQAKQRREKMSRPNQTKYTQDTSIRLRRVARRRDVIGRKLRV